ncbi:MAG: hypothetical protein GX093_10530 [Xanthomonadaceae bacterium]|nr:hypothetical protein [Xanthomonadaceae bacterium]
MPRGVASDRRRLLQLHAQLAQALRQDDWEAVIKVDQAIRELLQELATRPQLDDGVLEAKARLKKLHAQALLRCAQACERLWEQLLDYLDHAEARVAYQQVSQLGLEERG